TGTIPPGSGARADRLSSPAAPPRGARPRTGRMRRSDAAPEGSGTHGPLARRLTVLSGPSGVGKSTVVAEIRRSRSGVWVPGAVTTRPPRRGETHGVQY